MVAAVRCAPEARLQLQDRPLTRDQLACAVIWSTLDGYVGVLMVYRMASPVASHLLLFAFHLQNAGFRSGAEGVEPLASAVQRRLDRFPKVSGACKIPANGDFLLRILCSSFQEVYPGCCTVAAQTSTCSSNANQHPPEPPHAIGHAVNAGISPLRPGAQTTLSVSDLYVGFDV
jgi:hypothetical protein